MQRLHNAVSHHWWDLTNGVVGVVVVHLDEPVLSESALAPQEVRRAQRFEYERDRRRYVRSHVALRAVIAHAVGVQSASIVFSTAEHGKPFAIELPVDARFNLSHSGERALIGLTVARELGIDIAVSTHSI
jgi:4'-phosphopantetheinyl transferase